MTTIRIPSIAGAHSERWSDDFDPYITSRSNDGKPQTGRFGLNYDVTENLQILANRYHNNEAAMIEHLVVTTRLRNGGLLKPEGAKKLLDFYFWAVGNQPYFYLRKGRTTLGLYKKTSNYIFDLTEKERPFTWNPYRHRISYEFVSEAPPQVSQGLGAVPKTLVWKEAVVPATVAAPTSEERIEELEARLGRIHAAIVTFTADITEAMDRLSAAL